MDLSPEILLIDKPKGITSFDVIRRLRRKLNIRKMGHAGTLDPLATGLMIIGIGQGTKKLSDFIKLPKEYVAEILVGERRSTGDMEGEILESRDVPQISLEKITEVLRSMIGTIELEVSAYSAIKKDGVPMYKRARKAEKTGEKIIDLPVRNMEVTAIELLGSEYKNSRAVLTVKFNVASGTYIRSLAEEIGKRLGYPATLQNLRRTRVGEFRIEDAEKIEE